MIPLRDKKRSKTIPIVNYLLLALCGLVFLYELSLGQRVDEVVAAYGAVPARIAEATHGVVSLNRLASVLTAMFLHGGWLHLLGNMLYLYIFGHNVEDRLGHGGYLAFYLLSGIGATVVQVSANPESQVPMIGASGAIAGVLGAYFLLFPKGRILTMIPLFVYFPVIEVSAFFFLGVWFLLQFLQGMSSFGAESGAGGVAWWAHAGGFLVGALLLPIFLLLRRRPSR